MVGLLVKVLDMGVHTRAKGPLPLLPKYEGADWALSLILACIVTGVAVVCSPVTLFNSGCLNRLFFKSVC